MSKWDGKDQPKVPGAPEASKSEADGIVDKDAIAHTRKDIAGAEPDTAEAKAETAKHNGPRHVGLGGVVEADKARAAKTIKMVITTGGLMVRKSGGGYENLPTGTTFDVEEHEAESYERAGTAERA